MPVVEPANANHLTTWLKDAQERLLVAVIAEIANEDCVRVPSSSRSVALGVECA